MHGKEFGESETDKIWPSGDKLHVLLKEQVWPWPGREVPE